MNNTLIKKSALLDSKKIELLELYIQIVLLENSKYNLTAIRDKEKFWLKHIYDVIICFESINLNNETVADIGTGFGIPGIILKILFPDINLYLIESNKKKCIFLEKIVYKLNLSNCYVINNRAEELNINYCEKFDLVISRAMARLNILIEVISQLVKINGIFIAMKAKKYEEEIDELSSSYKILGFDYIKNIYAEDDFLGTRANIVYKKIKKTPKNFPRLYSQILKNPINKNVIKELKWEK